jgi:cation:H+ antiporter
VVICDLPFNILALVGLMGDIRYSGGVLTRRSGVSLVGLYFAYVVGRMLLFPGQ